MATIYLGLWFFLGIRLRSLIQAASLCQSDSEDPNEREQFGQIYAQLNSYIDNNDFSENNYEIIKEMCKKYEQLLFK